MSVESIHCYCYEYRRKSLISRGGHIGIGITLLRQTVITVIFTVPINFIHIQDWYAVKSISVILRIPKRSISPVLHKLDNRADSTRRIHNNAKSCNVYKTPLYIAGIQRRTPQPLLDVVCFYLSINIEISKWR